MQAMVIRGGNPLRGELTIHGAKNSALPVLAACLCCPGESVLCGCPEIRDVTCACQVLRQLGCRAVRQNGALVVDTSALSTFQVPPELARQMRSSVLFLGALAGRCGQAETALPGGCALGPRPVDLHIAALRQLGAEITLPPGAIACRMGAGCGGVVTLPYPSVGATENVMLAAAGCTRPVTIVNAAREPEIADLAQFLRAAGMAVTGAGSSEITLCAGEPLHGAQHTILPDRIETATYLSAVAAAGGEVLLCGTRGETLRPVLEALQAAGCRITAEQSHIAMRAPERLRGIGTVVTAPYPGFPTDAQPPLMAALVTADGSTRFVETVFSGRFAHVPALCRMGASIHIDGRIALIEGVPRLSGAHVQAADLRGGAALAVAALGAEGESTLTGLSHLHRGYADFTKSLQFLGADIKQVEIP